MSDPFQGYIHKKDVSRAGTSPPPKKKKFKTVSETLTPKDPSVLLPLFLNPSKPLYHSAPIMSVSGQ